MALPLVMRAAPGLAAFGAARLLSLLGGLPDQNLLTDLPAGAQGLLHQAIQPHSILAGVRENQVVLAADAALRQLPNAGLANRPVAVVTRDPQRPDADPKRESAWQESQQRYSALSSKSRSVVVPGAGHQVQLSHPQAVVSAIAWTVLAVRNP